MSLHADSDDSDQTGWMPRLIRDPRLCWAHRPFCWFCHEAAHFSFVSENTMVRKVSFTSFYGFALSTPAFQHKCDKYEG